MLLLKENGPTVSFLILQTFLLGTCLAFQEPIYIVAELMCNGSLLDYLKDGEGRKLKLPELVDMGSQVGADKLPILSKLCGPIIVSLFAICQQPSTWHHIFLVKFQNVS